MVGVSGNLFGRKRAEHDDCGENRPKRERERERERGCVIINIQPPTRSAHVHHENLRRSFPSTNSTRYLQACSPATLRTTRSTAHRSGTRGPPTPGSRPGGRSTCLPLASPARNGCWRTCLRDRGFGHAPSKITFFASNDLSPTSLNVAQGVPKCKQIRRYGASHIPLLQFFKNPGTPIQHL